MSACAAHGTYECRLGAIETQVRQLDGNWRLLSPTTSWTERFSKGLDFVRHDVAPPRVHSTSPDTGLEFAPRRLDVVGATELRQVDALWSIDFTNLTQIDDKALNVLASNRAVQEIHLSGLNVNVSRSVLRAFRSTPIQRVSISYGHLNQVGLEALLDMPQLDTFSCSCTGLDPQSAGALAHKQLRRVALVNCDGLDNDIVGLLSANPDLRWLLIDGVNQIGDAACNAISKIDSLEVLSLCGQAGISEEGIRSLSRCVHLKVLALNDIPALPRGGGALKSLTELQVLWVAAVPFTTSQEIAWIVALPSLRFLRMGEPTLSDNVVGEIGRCASLEELEISHSTELGGLYLVSLLEAPRLVRLQLGLTTVAFDAILLVRKPSVLRTLEIFHCPRRNALTDTGRQPLGSLLGLLPCLCSFSASGCNWLTSDEFLSLAAHPALMTIAADNTGGLTRQDVRSFNCLRPAVCVSIINQ